jgi:prepilin-type N-terminal cleavage/methylation domain-containing protein
MIRARRQAGFTLLEAMIASAVLAIGIVGVVGLQATLFSSARFSHDMSSASYLLQYRSEELGTYTIDQLDTTGLCRGAAPGCRGIGGIEAPAPASGCTVKIFDPQPISSPQPPDQGPYRVDVGILPHPDNINHPNARVATISVCWQDRGALFKQIQSIRVLGDR